MLYSYRYKSSKNKRIFKKEKYQLIYNCFLTILKNLEIKIEKEIKKIEKELEEREIKIQEQKLIFNFDLQKKLLLQLQNEKRFFNFIIKNNKRVFSDIDKKIDLLTRENFLQFLIYVFKEIREEKINNKEEIENKKIIEIVDYCIYNVKIVEAKNLIINFFLWPIRGKLDYKNNIFNFLINFFKKKYYFLEMYKKNSKPALNDEQVVMKFLCKSLISITIFIFTILILNSNSVVLLYISIISFLINEINIIKETFLDNKERNFLNNNKKKKEYYIKITNEIVDVLKSSFNKFKSNEQKTDIIEQLTKDKKKFIKKPDTSLLDVNTKYIEKIEIKK